MSKKDRESFYILGFILGMIAICLVVRYSAKFINPLYLGIFAVIVQVFIIMPRIAKMYYKIMGADLGFQAYVPIYNELAIYSPVMANVSLVIWLLDALILGMSCIENSVYESILGMYAAFNITHSLIWAAILVYLVQCLVRGIAMCQVSSVVYRKRAEFYQAPNKTTVFRVLQLFLYFIPFIRVYSFCVLFDKLYTMTKVSHYKERKQYSMEEE